MTSQNTGAHSRERNFTATTDTPVHQPDHAGRPVISITTLAAAKVASHTWFCPVIGTFTRLSGQHTYARSARVVTVTPNVRSPAKSHNGSDTASKSSASATIPTAESLTMSGRAARYGKSGPHAVGMFTSGTWPARAAVASA